MNPDIAVLILIAGLVLSVVAIIYIIKTTKPNENKKTESKKTESKKTAAKGSCIIGNFGKNLNEVKIDIALNKIPKKAKELKFEKIDNTPKKYGPEESPYETPGDDPMWDPDAYWFRDKYDYKWWIAKNGEEYYTRRR